jgi:hypothetical protein
MTTNDEISEQAAAIAWWIDPQNAEARRQLAERRPELGMWLDKVEAMVKAKLAERKAEEEAMKA